MKNIIRDSFIVIVLFTSFISLVCIHKQHTENRTKISIYVKQHEELNLNEHGQVTMYGKCYDATWKNGLLLKEVHCK